MKNFLLLSLLLISPQGFSQDISGSYRWILDDGRRYFEINLQSKNANLGMDIENYQGTHCGVFENGRRMDCSMDEYSINISRTSTNTYVGTILSAYSNTISEIKVTYLPSSGNIRWEVTKESNGQNYFPINVELIKD